ncbi:MAG: hypothetical protein M3Z84_00535 [Actinomycetota bacterium]|nr:hypothetical protein [Actinomycetota bacterium]
MDRVCESCASEDDDLVAVWPDEPPVPNPELWCAACRAERQHDLSDGD